MEFDIDVQKKHFKNHVAKIQRLGDITVIDFKNPKSINYRIRFVFEEDWFRLHISGDLGSLSATNYNNMTSQFFYDHYAKTKNVGYFLEKVDCCKRPIWYYDEEVAKKYLKEMAEDCDWEEEILDEYNSIEDWIDSVLLDYDDGNGISREGYEKLNDIDCNCFEYVSDIGKASTGIIELYLLAFRLAWEQLVEKGEVE